MRRRAAAGVLAAMIALSGCGSEESSSAGVGPAEGQVSGPDAGYVSGDGSIVLVPESERVPAPELTGTTLDGQTFTLRDHLGDVVVVNVWASWCAPCRAEAPVLADLARELADQGVQFVGLDTRDSDAAARAFVDRFGIDYPNVVDTDGQLQLLFSDTLPPQAIPSTLVIDAEGRVAGRALGKVSSSSLRGMIEPLLGEEGR
ncbi:MAG: TlpA disulfide reductase family protein [Candidatus Nanopelagicales bacterium]|nr:TlpA family protein disulfide reductase [Candidatus Nanopelagicales bacterium]